MKTFVRHAVTLLAITVACQAGLRWPRKDYYWTAGSDQTAATPRPTERPPRCHRRRRNRPALLAARRHAVVSSPAELATVVAVIWVAKANASASASSALPDWIRSRASPTEAIQSNFGEVTGVNIGSPMWGLEGLWVRLADRHQLRRLRFDGRSSTIDDPARRQTTNSSSPPASSARPSAISG